MAATHANKTSVILFHRLTFLCLLPLILQSCNSNKNIYKSDCDVNVAFKKVTFTHLLDSIKSYDQQYVEVSGTYKEAKEQSALYNDSLFVDHSNKHALWINFSQDCPLYLKGTRTGLFEANDDGFTPINNKKVLIRGKIDLHNTGYHGLYKGSIDRVSFIEL
ncbi:hypothetical protein [Mucilaginibacter xinganensis]|uniref:Uncharacterized protein n=1 Tax=Mucilaginibacter xinganensis TaxID=1234841 RepID=A0A223NUR6_9SPHI|nr:hypothetical protein [Mucilaginibacter xinganensis]ASU33500.1 hypothetical protein MuYL_1602 [Mucilaginibacter xinganensis]